MSDEPEQPTHPLDSFPRSCGVTLNHLGVIFRCERTDPHVSHRDGDWFWDSWVEIPMHEPTNTEAERRRSKHEGTPAEIFEWRHDETLRQLRIRAESQPGDAAMALHSGDGRHRRYIARLQREGQQARIVSLDRNAVLEHATFDVSKPPPLVFVPEMGYPLDNPEDLLHGAGEPVEGQATVPPSMRTEVERLRAEVASLKRDLDEANKKANPDVLKVARALSDLTFADLQAAYANRDWGDPRTHEQRLLAVRDMLVERLGADGLEGQASVPPATRTKVIALLQRLRDRLVPPSSWPFTEEKTAIAAVIDDEIRKVERGEW